MAENNPVPRSNTWDAPAVGPVTEHATIGSSIVIKGKVSGAEALFIDGAVEGSIHFPDHRVTVGRRSTVKANIKARDVVVMGTVKGNIQCGDLLDVRAEGSVEIQRAERAAKEQEAVKPVAAKAEGWRRLPVRVRLPKSLNLRKPSRRNPRWRPRLRTALRGAACCSNRGGRFLL